MIRLAGPVQLAPPFILSAQSIIHGWREYTASGRLHYTATGERTHFTAKGRCHFGGDSEPAHYTATGRIHYTIPEDDP